MLSAATRIVASRHHHRIRSFVHIYAISCYHHVYSLSSRTTHPHPHVRYHSSSNHVDVNDRSCPSKPPLHGMEHGNDASRSSSHSNRRDYSQSTSRIGDEQYALHRQRDIPGQSSHIEYGVEEHGTSIDRSLRSRFSIPKPQRSNLRLDHITCFNCSQTGHYSSECPHPIQSKSSMSLNLTPKRQSQRENAPRQPSNQPNRTNATTPTFTHNDNQSCPTSSSSSSTTSSSSSSSSNADMSSLLTDATYYMTTNLPKPSLLPSWHSSWLEYHRRSAHGPAAEALFARTGERLPKDSFKLLMILATHCRAWAYRQGCIPSHPHVTGNELHIIIQCMMKLMDQLMRSYALVTVENNHHVPAATFIGPNTPVSRGFGDTYEERYVAQLVWVSECIRKFGSMPQKKVLVEQWAKVNDT